jgi:hypothetical protein
MLPGDHFSNQGRDLRNANSFVVVSAAQFREAVRVFGRRWSACPNEFSPVGVDHASRLALSFSPQEC